jgi:hypothetical protein
MSTKKTNENPERLLLEGADALIKGFKTPAKFLSFLTGALYWTSIEGVSEDKGADQTFFIRLLINEVLQPWLKGEKDAIKEIGEGLNEVAGRGEYEEYNNSMGIITKGLGMSMQDNLYTSDYLNDCLSGIQTMSRIGHCVKLYDEEMSKIREQKKLSEAA